MARNDEFRQIVESGNSIYKYYVKNHVRFPELLRHNFFSKYEDRKMEDGVEVREFWRVKDYYMLLEFCQSQGISLCVAPTAYAELTFNPRKPETGYKDFTLVNSKEFRKLFKRILVSEEDYDDYVREREDLVDILFKKGIMPPDLNSRTGEPAPSSDMRVMADGAITGQCVITSDKHFISETNEEDMDRAKRIKNTLNRCGYIYAGSNGTRYYGDWVPGPYKVSFLCSKLEKSPKLLSFAINPNLVQSEDGFKYQPPLFER